MLVLTVLHALKKEPLSGLDPACALEMVHAYSLIHDDLPCMDDDDLRRGHPTLHKVFGEGMALLAGDYLLTLSFEVISLSPLSEAKKLRLVQILSKAAGSEGMVGGQAIDLASVGKTLDEKTLLRMHRGKTGALLAAALRFGAEIAGAPEETALLLENLGNQIGLAFQFLDDFLDASSTTEVLGKNVERDAAKNKPTAISFYGIEGVKERIEHFKDNIDQLTRFSDETAPLRSLLQETLWNRFYSQSQK